MTRPGNIGLHGKNSTRFNEVIAWVAAIDAFDFCDPVPLGELLRGNDEIPTELRPILADIVTGNRKPNKKAAAKLKVPASERMMIAAHISVLLGIIDMAKHEHSSDPIMSNRPEDRMKDVEIRANRKGIEVEEELRRTDAEREEVYRMVMDECEVSRETVENMVRALRKKMLDYPKI